jgi:hypothetical protein
MNWKHALEAFKEIHYELTWEGMAKEAGIPIRTLLRWAAGDGKPNGRNRKTLMDYFYAKKFNYERYATHGGGK